MEDKSVIVEHREHDGMRVLAVDTGMSSRALAQSKLVNSLSSRGFIFKADGSVDAWTPLGTYSEIIDGKEKTFIYGPDFDADPLLQYAEGNREIAWKALHASITAVNRAFLDRQITGEDVTNIAGAGPLALLPASDGTVLALPPDLILRCIAAHGEKAEIDNRVLWVHPDYRTINPSWAFSFMAGTVAYRIVSGIAPFAANRDLKRKATGCEAIGIDMRNGFFEPIDMAVWAIQSAAATCINSLVSTGKATSIDMLASFGPSIESVIDPARESIPESEEFAAKRVAYAEKIAQDAKREDFFRHYRTAFIVGGILFVSALVLLAVYIRDLNSGPDTLGLKPLEVVDGYYNAVENLDQEISEAYSVKGLKTDYESYISNFYVTSRIRLSYEGTGIVTPENLYALKNPGTNMIYGITRYESRNLMVSPELAECTVSFYYWLPLSDKEGETDTSTVLLSILHCTDRVSLAYEKNRWKITGIEKLESEPIPVDGDALLEMIKSGIAGDLPYAPADAELEKAKREREAKSGPLF
jgi:hypothetical protein